MIKPGAGKFQIAVAIALLSLFNIAAAKSRGNHKATKEKSSHGQSKVAHKARNDQPATRKSRIAQRAKKERPTGRQSRVAHKLSKERPTGRHSRLARRIKEPSGRRGRVAERTTRQQQGNRHSNNQIVSSTRLPESKAPSAPQNTPQKQKAAEVQIAPDIENEVIPPAPLIVKRSVNAIMIPAALAQSASNEKSDSKLESKPEAKSDSKPDAKFDSKYEERAVVASTVSVGSNFGYRRDPFTRRAKFHAGVDLKARWGDPVGASQAGTVQFAGWYHGYGNLVIVDHGGGVTTHYGHLSSFDVELGTHVERGTILGRAGSTGRATSPHLHYEVRIDGTATNPFQPLALDPSSDYFKLSRPTVDAGRASTPVTAGASQDK